MIYASLCDGIGAVHVAWQPLGWQCAWTSEIEPFPIAVVEQRFGYPNLGDMTKITKDQANAHGRIDLVVGGTPCQSFSVAGLRAGLDDPRGNLALEYLRLVDAIRPRWTLWENVPGVLSSGGGRDFGSIVGGLADLGYGWAYRVLDAQFFGVAQRRRRVFLVGHLGDWRRAAAVLFDAESLRGNPAPRREAWERTTPTIDASFGRLQGCSGQDMNHGHGHLISTNAEGSDGFTLTRANLGNHLNNQTPLIAHSLRAAGPDASEDGTGRGTPIVPVAFDPYNNSTSEQCPMLGQNTGQSTGRALAFQSSQSGVRSGVISEGVRRLTPRECERLQGFPDDYTAITYRNKPAADGPRYQALGNSMAVPVMRWIGERIQKVDEL
jgi:DNA (cytosine-5)-methyltransferase 1